MGVDRTYSPNRRQFKYLLSYNLKPLNYHHQYNYIILFYYLTAFLLAGYGAGY